jgi:hypothetical protein
VANCASSITVEKRCARRQIVLVVSSLRPFPAEVSPNGDRLELMAVPASALIEAGLGKPAAKKEQDRAAI